MLADGAGQRPHHMPGHRPCWLARLLAPAGHPWVSGTLQRPPLSRAGPRWQEAAKDAVSAWPLEVPRESGASLLQSAGGNALRPSLCPPLRGQPERVGRTCVHPLLPQGRNRALPSAWLSLPTGRALQAGKGLAAPLPAQALPWPLGPCGHSLLPQPSARLCFPLCPFVVRVGFYFRADTRGQKRAFCPQHLAFWFGLCVSFRAGRIYVKPLVGERVARRLSRVWVWCCKLAPCVLPPHCLGWVPVAFRITPSPVLRSRPSVGSPGAPASAPITHAPSGQHAPHFWSLLWSGSYSP